MTIQFPRASFRRPDDRWLGQSRYLLRDTAEPVATSALIFILQEAAKQVAA
jgi:hypothetical protein